jgi:hypothetical protein
MAMGFAIDGSGGVMTGKLFVAVLALAAAFSLSACGRIKEKAKDAIKSKIEEKLAETKAGKDADGAQAADAASAASGEAGEAPAAESATSGAASSDEDDVWYKHDFKIKFRYNDGISYNPALSNLGGGASGVIADYTIVRKGNAVYHHTVVTGGNRTETEAIVYRMEGDDVYSYLLNPATGKVAVRRKMSSVSLESPLLYNHPNQVFTLPKVNEKKAGLEWKKVGVETVAGVPCDVYEGNTSDGDLTAMSKEAGNPFLEKIAGTSMKDMLKNFMPTGTRRFYIAQGSGATLRCYIDTAVNNGKRVVGDSFVASFFQMGDIDDSEIPKI